MALLESSPQYYGSIDRFTANRSASGSASIQRLRARPPQLICCAMARGT